MADHIPKPRGIDAGAGAGKDHMETSKTATLSIASLPTNTPSTVVRASRVPTRLLVRNVGPTTLRLAYTANSLTGQANSGTDHYQLPSGGEDVFILAPQQGFYAVSVGSGGLLSYASSDALPVFFSPAGGGQ